MSAILKAPLAERLIVRRTRGRRHGPITRLVSPSDIGELIKPFVFLDLFDLSATNAPNFGWHPHSGIATLTVLHEGAIAYQETTGVKGTLAAGGVEWMRAGRGVWHTGSVLGTQQTRGFQLWIALPEELESAPCQSQYLSADEVPAEKPARVILGAHGRAKSAIRTPEGINYLDVQLAAGEFWIYQPPSGHEVAWLAVADGTLRTPEIVSAGELAVFEESSNALTIQADSASRFVLGSAVKHPHSLVLGRYSVHTTPAALLAGESEIQRIGNQLVAAGHPLAI
jgi:redox-sensitive bicupin YhaK (pirin superfamily)